MPTGIEDSVDIRKTTWRLSSLTILVLALLFAVALFGSVVAYDEFVTMPWLRRARAFHEAYWDARHRLDASQIRERECHGGNRNCEAEARLVEECMAEIAELEGQCLETLGVHPVALQDFEYQSFLEQIGLRF